MSKTQHPHDEAYRFLTASHLGIVVKGPRFPRKRATSAHDIRGIPSAIAADLKRLRIPVSEVISAHSALMVPDGWTNAYGPMIPRAKRLDRERKSYARRLRAMARDLESDVLPMMLHWLRGFGPETDPHVEQLPPLLKTLASYLAPGLDANQRQRRFISWLRGKAQIAPGRGRKHSTQLRDIRIDLLCLMFENRTGKPRHTLVARIMNWLSPDWRDLTTDDVKKARARAAPFSLGGATVRGELIRRLFCS